MEINLEKDPAQYSALTLAYLGDAVFELYIRNFLLKKGNCPANKLHKISKGFVSAPAQSKAVDKIIEILSREEEAVYKRGRNAKSYTAAKNATIVEYRRATGLESLIGYLYLKGEIQRLDYLMDVIISGSDY